MSSALIKHSYSLSRVWWIELKVINLETNYINISEQIDLYMHQNTSIYVLCMFVCVEVLWPSQPNGVMSSVVSLPNHTFTGQA